jgi:hypothetical protein
MIIINLRGTHGSGKSSVVRALLKQCTTYRIYGLLGPRTPEAYRCNRFKQPFYVLGGYESPATAGFDYVTKKGITTAVRLTDGYARRGNVLLESVLLSTRFMEPTMGAWFTEHKAELINATLTTTEKQCMEAIADRRTRSVGHSSSIHLERQFIDFGRVTERLKRDGFRVEYVSREYAVDKILGWLGASDAD